MRARPISAGSRSNPRAAWLGATLKVPPVSHRSLRGHYAKGLGLHLTNPKAILFYMGMLPGFFDLTRLTGWDVTVIVALSMVVPLAVLRVSNSPLLIRLRAPMFCVLPYVVKESTLAAAVKITRESGYSR